LEILFGLLEALLEILLEAALQLAGEAILVFFLTVITEAINPYDESRRPVVAGVGYFLLGAMTGGLSLVLFSSPLIHPSRFHGISLILSPLLTGSLMALLGSLLRKRSRRTVDLTSFNFGFLFAFGMASVRFLFAHV
jgi:hypothetical protein